MAMIGGDPRGVSAGIRFQAYPDWLGPTFDPALFEPGDYGTGSVNVPLGRLLDRRPGIHPLFCASDRLALAALETSSEETVAFYERLGFRITAADRSPDGGLAVWVMVREPTGR